MNLLKVWIQVEVTETKWVEVQSETAEAALKQYTPQKGERITGMIAFVPERDGVEDD